MTQLCHCPGTFKKMLKQKRKEQLNQYEKQEKRLKEMKSSGKSTKQAVSAGDVRVTGSSAVSLHGGCQFVLFYVEYFTKIFIRIINYTYIYIYLFL